MQQFFIELWHNTLYRSVLIFILIELLLLATQAIWLVLRGFQRRYQERHTARFHDRLAERFLDVLADPAQASLWAAEAHGYRESTVRVFLEPRIRMLAGESLEVAKKIYRDLGLVAQDVKMLESPIWHRRVLALRRLVFVAGPEEREVLLSTEGDHRSVALLAAQGLARIGSGDDVVRVLRNVDVPRRVMEQPVFVLLSSLSSQQFERVLDLYAEFRWDSLKKIVLVAAARRACDRAEALVTAAAESPSVELRLGAATAAAYVTGLPSEVALISLLSDEAKEVRALAAKGLGRRKALGALAALSTAASDPSFWVRQNVARALGALGEVGQQALNRLAEEGTDHFAADSARQELERLKVVAARSGAQP